MGKRICIFAVLLPFLITGCSNDPIDWKGEWDMVKQGDRDFSDIDPRRGNPHVNLNEKSVKLKFPMAKLSYEVVDAVYKKADQEVKFSLTGGNGKEVKAILDLQGKDSAKLDILNGKSEPMLLSR